MEPDRVRRERLEELTRAIRQLDPEELRRLRDFVAGLEAARRKEAAMVEEEASCVQEEQTETLDPAKCTPEQHAYTVQCTEDGHVLHWVRVEKHQWSDWQVEKEPDCEDPGELRSTCAVCGMVRWQRLAPLGHLLQFKPEDERHTIAVCRVCGRTLWRGPARDAVQNKKAARRSRSSTQNAAK